MPVCLLSLLMVLLKYFKEDLNEKYCRFLYLKKAITQLKYFSFLLF